jgi:Uma2 family endonuclease
MAATPSAPAPYRFAREEYYRMWEAGLFSEKRVELLDGEIITMAPQNPPRAGRTNRIVRVLFPLLGSAFSVRAQAPIVLNNWSEPEPDIAICRFDADDYQYEHPKAGDVLLVIEVADTSLAYDRGRKVVAYAGGGIPEYWITNLTDRRIEVFSDPDPVAQRYRQERFVFHGNTLTLPGGASLAAADIL